MNIIHTLAFILSLLPTICLGSNQAATATIASLKHHITAVDVEACKKEMITLMQLPTLSAADKQAIVDACIAHTQAVKTTLQEDNAKNRSYHTNMIIKGAAQSLAGLWGIASAIYTPLALASSKKVDTAHPGIAAIGLATLIPSLIVPCISSTLITENEKFNNGLTVVNAAVIGYAGYRFLKNGSYMLKNGIYYKSFLQKQLKDIDLILMMLAEKSV